MKQTNELMQEVKTLRERLSRFSEASLAINESLDFGTVLQGVLDTARSLTDARYGVITTLDESGQAEDFLTSGMTSEERRRLERAPGRVQFFKYFRGLQKPLRVPDFGKHLKSIDFAYSCPLAVRSFMAAPIRHQGQGVGYIHLGKQEPGGTFTREDEEMMTMFASQAALVITNARRYRTSSGPEPTLKP